MIRHSSSNSCPSADDDDELFSCVRDPDPAGLCPDEDPFTAMQRATKIKIKDSYLIVYFSSMNSVSQEHRGHKCRICVADIRQSI